MICEICEYHKIEGGFCPCVTNCRGAIAATCWGWQAQYLLKDNAGRLALYTPDGTGPLAQYDVYTRLLPEPDCLALQQGVSIYTEAELQQKLEDYGL